MLGTDGSPSDKLVVSGRQIAGNTARGIVNVNGPGARTTGNGILVVEAVNGATSAASAFALSSRVAAGAFDYQLFRGGFTAGSGSNWYLRNTITPQPPVPPDPGPPAPPSPPGPVDPDAGTNGNTEIAGIGSEPNAVPLYRPEVALHAVLPNVARSAVRSMLGTFHDREGEQAYASGDGAFQAGWGRVFGARYHQGWTGDVNPAFKGNMWGPQVGFPVLGLEHSGGEKDRAALFFGYSSVSGPVTGFADGQQGAPVGNVGLSIYSAGIY